MNTSDDDIWATPAPGQQPRPAPPPQPAPQQQSPPPHAAAQYPPPAGAPYGATPPDRNWMGIVSLVCGLVGLGLVGIVFGHLALRANARGMATNRGLSLAGTIVSYVTTVVGGLMLAGLISLIVTSDEFSEGFEQAWEPGQEWEDFGVEEADSYLELWVDREPLVGECLHYPTSLLDDLRVVDCDSLHVGEVFASAPVSNLAQGDDFVGDATQDRAMDMCDREFERHVGAPVWESDFDWWYFIATDDLAVDGDDPYICVASLDFEPTLVLSRDSSR